MTSRGWRKCLILIALSVHLKLRADAPSQAELRYLYSVLPLIQAHELTEAEGKLLIGLKEFPRSAVLSNALGMVYEQEKKTRDAIRAFEQATEWLPNFTAAQLHLASLLAETGACDRASPLLLAVEKQSSEPGVLAAVGIGLAQCKDYASATPALERAHSLDPEAATTTFNLALAQFRQGDFGPALRTLDSLAATSEKGRPETLFLRGKVLQAMGKPGAAVAMAEACRSSPADDYCSDAAIELIQEEQFVEAVDLLENALTNRHPSVTLLSTLGLAQFRLGRYRGAIGSYSKAIELDPDTEAPREGLGFLLYMTGDLSRARSVVEQAAAKANSDFYLPYLQALVLYRMGRPLWPESLSSLANAMKRNPRFAPAYFLRGKILMENGELNQALGDFRTAAGLDTKYALPYYKMAQIYLRQGRSGDAERAQLEFFKLGSLREEEVLARQAQDQLLSRSR
jgi:tetratricopeptide (TPR) repeat protein